MIRIDEIYNNVFLPRVQDLENVSLHWFDPFGSKSITDIVTQPQIDGSAHRIIFWDQEPLYREHTQKFFDEFCEIYRPPRPLAYHTTITLITSELHSEDVAWVQNTYNIENVGYYFFHGWAALDWYRGYNHSFLWQPWKDRDLRHRIFCPNNLVSGQRSHRVRLISGMDQRGLIKHNLISLPVRCPFSGVTVDDICSELGLPMIQDLPFEIDGGANHAGNSHRIDFYAEATRCFCHVVTETVYHGRKWHLTEKTFKPIVLQQPFVLVAPQGSLQYLRSYGFRTFDTIWPETYDSLPDDQRIEAVLDLLDEINGWSDQDIAATQQDIQSVVRHNHDWFYGGFQDLLWNELCGMVQEWP